ncbi:MAG: nucleotidyltransferase family protein [Phycisphaerae bacterium]
MINVIDKQRDALTALCRRHRVRRLELFGSAADGTYDPAKSDLDFLVVFFPMTPGAHYEAYFGLWEALRALFGTRIDLVEARAMRNPYFVRRVNESRKPVYAA